jgi:predicted metal-dependent HD superfamily phosphohydrolase
MFNNVFVDTLSHFTTDGALVKKLWEDIESHYSSPSRYYHNLSHLNHITKELLEVKGFIKDWDLVVFAIAYHDIIYDVLQQNNEEESADHAQAVLRGLIDIPQINKLKQLILATKGHTISDDTDINYFTDSDLVILGSDWEKYLHYSKQIRKEYSYYPDDVYKLGRQKVLKHFLDMDRIYKTFYFNQKYETQARSNLHREYEVLKT